MSNAKIRQHLERQSAPVIAFMIDNGWVDDDCGILNARYGNIREGLLVAHRTLNGAVAVPIPRGSHNGAGFVTREVPVPNAFNPQREVFAGGYSRRTRERL
jgi:hypothetical protein